MGLLDKLFPKEDGNLTPPIHHRDETDTPSIARSGKHYVYTEKEPVAKVESPPVKNSDIVPIYFYDKNDFQSVDTAVAILSEAIRALRHQSYTKLRVRLEIDALQHPDD